MTTYTPLYSFPNLEPVCCSVYGFNVASCPAYRFLRKQVRWSGISISLWIFHSCDPQSQKGFRVVNEAEIDVFLQFSYFFYDAMDVGNVGISSAFSKSSFYIWKFSVHIQLQLHLKNFEHDFASVWDECNYAVVWTLFGNALLWDWNENLPFLVLWPLPSFPDLLAYWVQYFHSIIF